MKIIDYRLPDDADPLDSFSAVWVAISKEGYKPWLEAATGTARAEGLEPMIDLRPEGTWRGVHGYLSFGLYGNARLPSPYGRNELTTKTEWCETYFLNWKENFMEPRQLKYNIIRLWLRHDVEAYVQYWSKTPPLGTNVEARDPVTGQVLYPASPFSSYLSQP